MSSAALANDRAARRAAQTVFDRPVVLEAGAGTGKTTALVGRLLAWTLGAGWDELAAERPAIDDETLAGALLEGVVAITFTEAAAAEMAARSQHELARLSEGAELEPWFEPAAFPAEPEVRARRARALLAAIDRLRVQTIHSFAFSLLRTYALDGDLHPALAVDADEGELREIVLDVLAARLPPLYQGGDPHSARLARAGFGPERLRTALLEMTRLGLGAESLAIDPWRPAAIASALDPAAAAAERLATALAGARFAASARNSAQAAERAPALAEALRDAPRTRAGVAALAGALAALWPPGARKRIDDWSKGSFNKGESEHLGEATGAVTAAARRLRSALRLLERIDPDLLDSGRELLRPLAAEVERRMRARGRATYSDLLRLAVELLALPRVASDARRGIRQLLIDELQDTDDLQCELVSRLALEGPADERPGLFLVGDPKQSIYGWRRARLTTYQGFVESALAGEAPAPLVANFRSAEGLLAEVERAVAPVMASASDVAAPYVPLAATGARVGAAGEVEYWVAWDLERGKPLPAGESVRREAAAIAADLALRIGSGRLEPGDAALLLRATTPIDRYLEALRERGVPYAVEKDRSYYRRRETIDAAALVRTLLDPADRPALVAWLRSPWVGVPDAALWPLFEAGLPERIAQLAGPETAALDALDTLIARAAAATPAADPGLVELAAWPAALRAALRALAERRSAFTQESPDLWVDGVRAAFLPDLVAAARFQGRYRLANLDRFFRELAERLSGEEPVHRLLAELRAAARERPDEPESRPLEGAGNAVRVMTIHSAKGLEFEEVYLAAIHHEARGRGDAAAVEAERIGATWEYRLFGVPTPGLAPAADLAERIRAAEQVRMLYVAYTRARRRLVVTGALPVARRESDPEQARSLGALLAHRLPAGDLATRLADAGETGLRDEHGARWRLLPAPAAVAAEVTSTASQTAEGDPEEALARLAALRSAARARSARPRVARATEVAVLEAERAEPEREVPPSAAEERSRAVALARGTGLHRALELAPMVAADRPGWRAAALATFARELRDASAAEHADFAATLERLERSTLLARLHALAPRVVARELPVLLAAAAVGDDAPLDAVAGAIDLVYLDDGGGPVVADFKSDAVDAEGVADLVARYAPQLDLYARALAAGLGLAAPPRRELWLLALDRIERLLDPPRTD